MKEIRFWCGSRGPEGNDLTAFQNIPLAGFGARAAALMGESSQRCFRAQWRCYHTVSGLNGLPTVCLKDSHNDRDQLITATLHTGLSDRLTLEQASLRLHKDMAVSGEGGVVGGRGLQHTHMVSDPHSHMT